MHHSELRYTKLPGEIGVERDLRSPGIDEEGDRVAAIDAHAHHRQRIGLQERQTRTLSVALHLIRRLALETLQLCSVQCRTLRNNQLVAADVDAIQRSRRLLEIVAAIKYLGNCPG